MANLPERPLTSLEMLKLILDQLKEINNNLHKKVDIEIQSNENISSSLDINNSLGSVPLFSSTKKVVRKKKKVK